MNDVTESDALALADLLENNLEDYSGNSLPLLVQDIADRSAAELRRLYFENEVLKFEAIEQCKIIGGSAETELRLRAEDEALRKYKAAAHLIAEDAGRFQWVQDHALAIDTVADPDNQVQIWHGTDPARCTYGKTLSEAVDKAMKEQTDG